MKRIMLFLGTNIAVLIIVGFLSSVLGVDRYLTQNGLNLGQLLVFCALFGFTGSFVSLLLSKPIAKMSTGAKVIDKPSNAAEAWLLQTVTRQARQAGIGMPEVAIYDSPDMNAFATGASRNNALVAVSTGLLTQMRQDEVEAVLGHEVSHIANGDMITLTLVQGVVNTFVMFLARVVGYFIDRAVFKNDRGVGMGYYATVFVLQIVFGIMASAIVAWFSRQREFRADAGGAHLAGKRKMIEALQRLQNRRPDTPGQLPEQMAAFGIAQNFGGTLKALFASHPPLEQRIAALQQQR
ncbi:MAG: protease HtpX [Oceanococcaceae bacterium]